MTDPKRPAMSQRETEAAERGSLDRSLAVGIAWMGGIKWISQIVSWIGTLIVARLLVPEDFGILGMATFVLGFMELVNEFGIGAAVIQRKEISKTMVSHLGAFSIALGAFLMVLGILLSTAVAAFFIEPRVKLVMMALSANFLVGAFRVIPRSLLTRDMQFRLLAAIDGVRALATTLITVALAWGGFAYWSLVVGTLAGNVGSAIWMFRYRPFRPSWPRAMSEISRELEFGWNVVSSRIAWYAYSNADFAVVGRALGTAALGAYNIGWTLASLPVEKISVMIMQVTPPVFAKVQDRPGELSRYLCLLTEGISILTFPVGIGMALVAPEFVLLALGSDWAPAVVPLQILALYGGFRSVTPFFAQILVATDHARLSMWFNVAAALLLVPSFIVGARWGTTGVALAWVVVYPLFVAVFSWRYTFRIIQLPVLKYGKSLWPALSASLVMALVVVGLGRVALAEAPDWVKLAAMVPAGGAAYAATILTLHRKVVTRALGFVRSVRANG